MTRQQAGVMLMIAASLALGYPLTAAGRDPASGSAPNGGRPAGAASTRSGTSAPTGKTPSPNPADKLKTTPAPEAVSRGQAKLDELEADLARLLAQAAQPGADTRALHAQISYRMVIRHLYETALAATDDLQAEANLKADTLDAGLASYDALVAEAGNWDKVLVEPAGGPEHQKLQARLKTQIDALTKLDSVTENVNRDIEDTKDLGKYLKEMLVCLDALRQAEPLPAAGADGGAAGAGERAAGDFDPWPAPPPVAAASQTTLPSVAQTLSKLRESSLPQTLRTAAETQLASLNAALEQPDTAENAAAAYRQMLDALALAERVNASTILTSATKDKITEQCQLGLLLAADARSRSAAGARLAAAGATVSLMSRLEQASQDATRKPMTPLATLFDRSTHHLLEQPRNKEALADLASLDAFVTAYAQFAKLRDVTPGLAKEEWQRLRGFGDDAVAAGIDGFAARLDELDAQEAARKAREDEAAGRPVKEAEKVAPRKLKMSLPDATHRLAATGAAMARIGQIPALVKVAAGFQPTPTTGLGQRAQHWMKLLVDAVDQNSVDTETVHDMDDFQAVSNLLLAVRDAPPVDASSEILGRLTGGKLSRYLEKLHDNERKLINALAASGRISQSADLSGDLQGQFDLLRAGQEYARLAKDAGTITKLNAWGAWQVDDDARKFFMDQAEAALTGEFQNALAGTAAFGAPTAELVMLTYKQAGPAIVALGRIQQTIGPRVTAGSTWASSYLQALRTPGKQAFYADQQALLARICFELNEADFNKRADADGEAQKRLAHAAELLGKIR
jgi:hypothetical protein